MVGNVQGGVMGKYLVVVWGVLLYDGRQSLSGWLHYRMVVQTTNTQLGSYGIACVPSQQTEE